MTRLSSGDIMRETIGCVTLLVRDYDEALAYFRDRLGFDLVEDTDLGGGKRWVVVAPPGGGTGLLLARAATPEQAARVGDQTGGRVFLFLRTDDFQRDYHALRARGVAFVEEPRREPFGTVAVFTDLYGNRWDLVEPVATITRRPVPTPRLIVWDFDGTLADSLAAAVEIFNRLAPELGFRPVEDVAAARAMTTREFLRQHGISFWRLPRVARRFRAAAADESAELKLFAGLPDVLAGLRERGIRLGILSSNSEDNIRRCLVANGVEQHFAFVVGYPRLFGKGKALRRILRAEKLDRSAVLYVGDEVRDVEAAQRAGVPVAAVTWGFHAEPILRASDPDHLVSEPRQLLELVSEMRTAG
jgi:phosphoglycolate phosphatase